MDKNAEAAPNKSGTPTEAQTAAEKVRAARQAKRAAKAAAAEAKKLARKTGMGQQAGGKQNPFSVPAGVSKKSSIPRSIISRARGGRSR
jgi:hypothetical protein